MTQKEFSLGSQSRPDILVTFDVLLTPIDHTNITCKNYSPYVVISKQT